MIVIFNKWVIILTLPMRKSIVNIAGTRPQFVKASIMMKFIDEKLT